MKNYHFFWILFLIYLFCSQVTSDGGGGMVSSRDFVYAAKTGYKGDVFVMGGRSVDYKDAPSSSKIVRCESIPPAATSL